MAEYIEVINAKNVHKQGQMVCILHKASKCKLDKTNAIKSLMTIDTIEVISGGHLH